MRLLAEQVSCRYPGQTEPALHDIDLELSGGSTVLVSGSTGSGKSTLALVLCGAIPHLLGHVEMRGRVVVDGQDLARIPMRQAARCVGLLMQNVEYQVFTDGVEDEIAFGLENFAVPPREIEERVAAAMHTVGAAHLRGRTLATLSSGERQRVMIAALVGLGQRVLILDEPLAYLDRHGAIQLVATLDGLARTGTTVVVLEHRRDLIRPAVHREIRLESGRLASGPAPGYSFPEVAAGRSRGDSRLILERAACSRGTAPVLRDLSMQVQAGESVVLLGDNGAGKTTLLRLALGLELPTAGVVRTCGLDVARTSTRRLAAEAALVLQNPDHQLFLETVQAEVASSELGARSALQEIEALGLGGLEARHPQSLSTGQKRRVTIASALARRPKLLLLDEPTLGQDDASLALVLRRLARFVDEGGALVTATHDERAARALGSRILLLGSGRILGEGPGVIEDFFLSLNSYQNGTPGPVTQESERPRETYL